MTGERIRKHVFGLGASEKEWRVLVIDKETARLLHYSLPMSEILSQNVAMIERIEEPRGECKEFSAIYFIGGKSNAVKHIEKDLSKKIYTGAYIVSTAPFTSKDISTLERLRKKAEKKKEKGENISFVYKCVLFDFVPLSSDLFEVQCEYSYYKDRENYLESIVQRIKGVFRTLGSSCTPICVGKNAEELGRRIDSTGPGKIIIVERGIDLYTPLMHYFTFESLLWDIELGGPGYVIDRESKGEEEEKKIEVGVNNEVWESVRNTQLVQTHEILSGLIRDATKSSEKEEKGNIKRLIRAVQELPSHTKTLKEIKVLMGLLEECINYFNANGMREVVEVEQGISTGKDAEGKSFGSRASKRLFDVLEAAKLTKEEKIRLCFLFMFCYGEMQKNELKTLIMEGHITKTEIERYRKLKSIIGGRAAKPVTKGGTVLQRYIPVVRDIVQGIIGKDQKMCRQFGIQLQTTSDVLTGESLRKREFVFHTPKSTKTENRKPIIIYFIGGVCIAEITEIREIAKHAGVSILIGSTDIYSPNGFLKMLHSI